MLNIVIKMCGGQAYEITDRHTAPRSSSANRYRNDPWYTGSLIRQLPLEPHDWLGVMEKVRRRPLEIFSSHPAEVYDAVTEAVMRGELAIYKLPQLDATHSLRGKNAKTTGLCFVRGPDAHCATELRPEPIGSIEEAKALLDEIGISEQLFLGELAHKGLYNSYQQHEPMQAALKMLASGETLAYKIPMPPMSKPPKPVEYEDISGPKYQPVPLGPEPSAAPKTKAAPPKPAPAEPTKNTQPAQSIEECEQRLAAARERLKTDGYQPKYTDEELRSLAEKGELDDRFVVRLTVSDYAGDEDYLGQMTDGEVKYWSTTFNQMENGDTDPKTLCALIGVDYQPGKTYKLIIVDTQAKGAGQSATIVPTHKNLGTFAKSEIKDIDPEAVDKVMTPEYNEEYAKQMQSFKSKGFDLKKDNDIRDFSDANFSTAPDKTAFKSRVKMHKKLGANEYFTGDGTTKSLLKECPNKSGVMETFTYDKSPQTLGQLEANGSAKRVATSPL